jgi:hypothetical protein
VLRAVYAQFPGWCSDVVTGFPVGADDDIARVYGMVDEDLEEAVRGVLAACGRRLPPHEHQKRVGPVVTVRDFVRLVQSCPAAG